MMSEEGDMARQLGDVTRMNLPNPLQFHSILYLISKSTSVHHKWIVYKVNFSSPIEWHYF